jgi:hypothetical protein
MLRWRSVISFILGFGAGVFTCWMDMRGNMNALRGDMNALRVVV